MLQFFFDFIKRSYYEKCFCYKVLTNGIEVKLQRNALSVIEAPTGNEEVDDLEFEQLQWNSSDMGEHDFILYSNL